MEELIHIKLDGISLEGMLNIPTKAKALILFAHGSGSSRLSPRNNYVAKVLQKANFATLLIDLLSEKEDIIYENRFNIELLVERLIKIIEWLKKEKKTKELTISLFGASTGAAAALMVAEKLGKEVKAVVSRGGRPDLAQKILHKVVSPTLLIVGENDFGVVELNEQAFASLKSTKEISYVKGATHLFEEAGCLEKAAELAKNWFIKYA